MSIHQTFKTQNASFANVLDDCMLSHPLLSATAATISSLYDHQEGPIGTAIIDNMNELWCGITDIKPPKQTTQASAQFTEAVNPVTKLAPPPEKPKYRMSATYVGFGVWIPELKDKKMPYTNIIKVAPTNNWQIFAGRVLHEQGHFEQQHKWAPMHASPYNLDSERTPNIVLHPESWIKLLIAGEGEAYAKTAWQMGLAGESDPRFYDATELTADPVSAREFENIRQQYPSLEEALAEAAKRALNAPHQPININGQETRQTFAQYYARDALKLFDKCSTLDNPPPGTIYVTITDEDLTDIGLLRNNISIPNPLSLVPALDTLLDPESLAKLDALSQKLPTMPFKDALIMHGFTPHSFVEASMPRPEQMDIIRVYTPSMTPQPPIQERCYA